ncbi:hypothetical protein PR202_gb23643 [Eleusine coracana subsp. coracana]|uniref:Uncharacterized protein n=1 Tax=Eleusine coracana subsp. coracana TaxID=191504 RepID=A0AAV5FIR2_ELECO|nr:hypothetical protein PR202_gb23643 [Eleusine coracana subsp. coracana]
MRGRSEPTVTQGESSPSADPMAREEAIPTAQEGLMPATRAMEDLGGSRGGGGARPHPGTWSCLMVIIAANIDAAAEQILDQLKADTSSEGRSKGNVIYFDGWDGLGASAVLQAVAQRLAAVSGVPTGLQFGKIIHI